MCVGLPANALQTFATPTMFAEQPAESLAHPVMIAPRAFAMVAFAEKLTANHVGFLHNVNPASATMAVASRDPLIIPTTTTSITKAV
jgi:hypothetical protein